MKNSFYQVLKASLPQNQTDLFTETGLTHLSDLEKEQLLDQFVLTLQKRMAAKTWEMVDEKQKGELMELSKTNPGKAQLQLLEIVPDYLVLYRQEALDLRKEFISRMKGDL